MIKQIVKKIPLLEKIIFRTRRAADLYRKQAEAFFFYRFPSKSENLLISDSSHFGADDRGLFSLFREVLDIIAANGLKNITVDYRKTLYNDRDTENMWGYYFEPINNARKNKYDTSFMKVRAYSDPLAGEKIRHIKLFHQIIRDRIRIKTNLNEKVRVFSEQNFKGKKIIGIHYRGTDIGRALNNQTGMFRKALPEEYFSEIDKLLAKGFEKVFLATDDQKIFEKFQAKYGEKLIYYSKHRSQSSLGLHYYHSERYGKHAANFGKREIGEEVVIDALLLAKTDYFIYGDSNVAVFVRYFNSDLISKNMDIVPKPRQRKSIGVKIKNRLKFYLNNFTNSLRPTKIFRTFLYHAGIYKLLGTNVSGLNLGAGTITIDDFWNLDSRFPFKSTTIVAGVEKIKLKDNSVGAVYCAHIFEHLDRTRKLEILKEWHRILKPGGTLYIAVPDLEVLCGMYLNAIKNYGNDESKDVADRVMRIVHGGQAFPQDKHFYGYSFASLENFLKIAGFKKAERFDTRNLPFTRNKDDDSLTTLNNTLISLNVKTTK